MVGRPFKQKAPARDSVDVSRDRLDVSQDRLSTATDGIDVSKDRIDVPKDALSVDASSPKGARPRRQRGPKQFPHAG
jgi:hypothetical protein